MVRGKKFILIMLSLAMVLAMAIGFAACNNGPKLEAVPAKDASCEYDGNIAYWKDPATGKFYSDEAGEHEIAESDTVIAATGHTYAETWSSDDTNHWHQATCEHSDKIRDRAEHTYSTWKDLHNNEGFTGKEVLPCTVCGHERPMEEAYQMYVIGNIAGYPTAKWTFKTKADCSDNCLKMTYDEATGTFSAEVIIDVGNDFAVYNLAEGQTYPAKASQSSTDALRVEKRSTYIISWKLTGYDVTVTEHEHTFTKNNYKYTGSEHWLECDSNDGAVKEGSRAAHDTSSGACECGFSPATCKHEAGFIFNYSAVEGGTLPPDPVAEGGTLKRICPYCFKEEDEGTAYDIGVTTMSTTPEAMTVDKTYYYKGSTCYNLGLHFTEAGTYTLTLENVCYGAPKADLVYHRTLTGIAYSTKKMPSGGTLTAGANEKSNNTKGIIWYYNTDGNWLTYSDTYAEMKAAVEKWKAQMLINGDPNYHYDKEVGMVDLTSIKFTITEDDLTSENGLYFTIRLTIASGMNQATQPNNAFLAKVTKAAAPAPTLAPQPIALLPQKKNY